MARPLGSILDRQLRTAEGRADSRRKLMQAVHAAARRHGMDDETRKAMQKRITGIESLKDMSPAQIGQVLDHLNRDGKPLSKRQPWAAKIRALWWTLYWIGQIESASDASLDRFVERQTGKPKLAFVTARDAHRVIEALKSWAARGGGEGELIPRVRWPSADYVAEMAASLGPDANITQASMDRHAVLHAIDQALVWRGMIRNADLLLQSALKTPVANGYFWSDRMLDEGIRILGKMLRRALDKERRSRGGDGAGR